jgi:hypothetical protein
MAAKSVTVSNTKDAIDNGTFNGHFVDNVFEFNTIQYKIGRSNKTAHWTISIKLLNAAGEIIPITDDMLKNSAQLDPEFKTAIETISGQEGGKIRDVTPTYITTGKNIGKANETNIVTQAFRDALGLYNKKLSKVASNIVAEQPRRAEPSDHQEILVNLLKKRLEDAPPPPMLVQKIQNNPLTELDFANGVTLQRKLNGVHYITFMGYSTNDNITDDNITDNNITDDNTIDDNTIDGDNPDNTTDENFEIIKYSRSGLIYPKTSMPKITKEMETIFNNSMMFCSSNETLLAEMKTLLDLTDAELELYKGAKPYYAGELYKHGISLNIISGQARKEHSSIDLEYHIFDVFFPSVIEKGHNLISEKRQLFIDYIFEKVAPLELTNIKRVENFPVHNMLEINALVDSFIADGYEGAIARRNNGIYIYSINNYHSREVLKIKPTFDAEFTIVGFTQGTKGKDLGAIIWLCAVPDKENLQFHVVPNMPLAERKKLYKKLSEESASSPIGKLLTVSYAELSPNGIPLQPKGIAIRDYE